MLQDNDNIGKMSCHPIKYLFLDINKVTHLLQKFSELRISWLCKYKFLPSVYWFIHNVTVTVLVLKYLEIPKKYFSKTCNTIYINTIVRGNGK